LRQYPKKQEGEINEKYLTLALKFEPIHVGSVLGSGLGTELNFRQVFGPQNILKNWIKPNFGSTTSANVDMPVMLPAFSLSILILAKVSSSTRERKQISRLERHR
jgi:hypothetical protein